MKKIILGLFLILGAISFAAPKFVDMAKVFSTANISSKEISDLLKSNALRNSENFIATLDNNRAYINEFEAQGFYSYMIVPKKEKVKNQHTYATYVSSKKLSKNDLSKITNAILDEAESYIK